MEVYLDFLKKHLKFIVSILLILGLGLFFLPRFKKIKKTMVNKSIRQDVLQKNETHQERMCRKRFCPEISDEDCEKNYKYKQCVKVNLENTNRNLKKHGGLVNCS